MVIKCIIQHTIASKHKEHDTDCNNMQLYPGNQENKYLPICPELQDNDSFLCALLFFFIIITARCRAYWCGTPLLVALGIERSINECRVTDACLSVYTKTGF